MKCKQYAYDMYKVGGGANRKDPGLPSAILCEYVQGQKANSIKRNEPINPGAKALMFKKLGALSSTEYTADNISNNLIVLEFSNLLGTIVVESNETADQIRKLSTLCRQFFSYCLNLNVD